MSDLAFKIILTVAVLLMDVLIGLCCYLIGRKKSEKNQRGDSITHWETMTSEEIDKQLDKVFRDFEKSVEGLEWNLTRAAKKLKKEKQFENLSAEEVYEKNMAEVRKSNPIHAKVKAKSNEGAVMAKTHSDVWEDSFA